MISLLYDQFMVWTLKETWSLSTSGGAHKQVSLNFIIIIIILICPKELEFWAKKWFKTENMAHIKH